MMNEPLFSFECLKSLSISYIESIETVPKDKNSQMKDANFTCCGRSETMQTAINAPAYRSKIERDLIDNFKEFKSFILNLYSQFSSSNSDSDIMIHESMIFSLSIAGKFLFIQDSSYDELRSLMNQLIYDDHFIFKSLLNFMFLKVSSL